MIEAVHSEANLTQQFVYSSGMVDFEENQNSTFIRIEIRDDSVPELDEMFTVALYQVEGLCNFGLNYKLCPMHTWIMLKDLKFKFE